VSAARIPLFEGLSPAARAEALAAFQSFEVGPGEELLVEGEADRGMLVVVEGQLQVTRAGVSIARLGPGDTAGEMALFGSSDLRFASVTTVTACKLLVLDEQGIELLTRRDHPLVGQLELQVLRVMGGRLREMNQLLTENAARRAGQVPVLALAVPAGTLPAGDPPDPLDTLRAAPGFSGQDPRALLALADRFELVAAPSGTALIEEGRRPEAAYIVASGRVGVTTRGAEGREVVVAVLPPGATFGQVALADAQARSATCRALDPAFLLRIPSALFQTLETEASPAGRAFRRAMIDTLAGQLKGANEQVAGGR
jgi:CRP-like cAMP-binding protein